MTGLPTPGAFAERLNTVLRGRREGDRGIALLQIELGGCAAVRASQGHVAGDLMLRHAAMRLLEMTRAEDIACRLGPATFGVALTVVRHPAEVAGVCARLVRSLAEPFDLPGGLVEAEPRIGATFSSDGGKDAAALDEEAAQALAGARADPPGRYAFFDPALHAEAQRFRTLDRDLGTALEQGRFRLKFQPRIAVADRRVIGAEALLRWDHPCFGPVLPETFLPMAEDRGVVGPIGIWLLEEACTLGAGFARVASHPFGIAVDLSPLQLRTPGLAASVGDILTRTGFPPSQLTLKVTTRMPVRDTDASFRTLVELADLGVELSLADFGLGASSFTHLLHVGFDEIEVARCLVADADRDPTSAAIVRATIGLARDLGLASVADGVETEAQYALLGELGCTIVQGRLFGEPVEVAEMRAIVTAAGDDDASGEPVCQTG